MFLLGLLFGWLAAEVFELFVERNKNEHHDS